MEGLTPPDNEIHIHPPGTRVTDMDCVVKMAKRTPKSFKIAQHVLVCTSKYIRKKGIFSSEKSRAKNLYQSINELNRALDRDFFMHRPMHGPAWRMIEYFSHISDAFPNWQKEYEALNTLIPSAFRENRVDNIE